MKQFEDKTIVLTGATSGIGKAIALKLNELGANLALCGRSEDKMAAMLAELSGDSDKVLSAIFDLSEYAKIDEFVQQTINQFGKIDILINCAGANSSRAHVNDIELEDLQSMLDVNMLAPFVFMQKVFNHSMKKQGGGLIINIMSTVCLFSNEGIGAYTASKTGFDGLMKVFRKEVRDLGVKVCGIYPGGVDTPFREAERPLYLDPQDVVEATLYVANQSEKACVDELVVRPMIEKNYG